MLQETVDVFGHIEDDDDQNQHRDGEKESPQVLLEDICVYFFHLQAFGHFLKRHVAPFGKVASDDVFAGLAYQP